MKCIMLLCVFCSMHAMDTTNLNFSEKWDNTAIEDWFNTMGSPPSSPIQSPLTMPEFPAPYSFPHTLVSIDQESEIQESIYSSSASSCAKVPGISEHSDTHEKKSTTTISGHKRKAAVPQLRPHAAHQPIQSWAPSSSPQDYALEQKHLCDRNISACAKYHVKCPYCAVEYNRLYRSDARRCIQMHMNTMHDSRSLNEDHERRDTLIQAPRMRYTLTAQCPYCQFTLEENHADLGDDKVKIKALFKQHMKKNHPNNKIHWQNHIERTAEPIIQPAPPTYNGSRSDDENENSENSVSSLSASQEEFFPNPYIEPIPLIKCPEPLCSWTVSFNQSQARQYAISALSRHMRAEHWNTDYLGHYVDIIIPPEDEQEESE